MLVLVIDAGGVLGGARVELVGGDHARVEQQALERRQPALVVARVVAVLLGRRDLGDQAVAEVVPGVHWSSLSATAMPKTRPSQGASKTSSPFLRGTARSSPRSSMRWSVIAAPRC